MRKKRPPEICSAPDGCALQREYQAILDSACVGIAITHDFLIAGCNPRCEEIFGYGPGQLDGAPVRQLFPSAREHRQAIDSARAALGQGGEFMAERRLRRQSGEPFWCGFGGRAVAPGVLDGETETIVWTFQDIDRRKKAEIALAKGRRKLEAHIAQRTATLESANRMLQAEMQARRRTEDKQRTQQAELARMARINTAGEMVSALAHELGQPLASMLNYAHGCLLRLASGNATQEELKHGLIQAVRNAEQAGEIVRRVRRFLHKQPPEKRLYDINQVVHEISALLEPEARRQEISLRIRRADTPLKAMVDRVEIEQIVVNLVKNAFEAMEEGPGRPRVVELACLENADDNFIIAVADSGPGVPQYLRTSVFEPFFTTKNEGMGFGLAICGSLVEMHGGTMRVDESWLGGALFEIILPRGTNHDKK